MDRLYCADLKQTSVISSANVRSDPSKHWKPIEIDIDDDFEGTALGQTEDAPADPLDEFLDGIF